MSPNPPNPHDYPFHANDAGPFLPTTSGGLICGKCHMIIRTPNFPTLRAARDAHAAAGERPVNIDRPSADRIKPSDLTETERHLIRMVGSKRANRTVDSWMVPIASLVALSLVKEEPRPGVAPLRTLTEHGRRLFDLDAAQRRQPEQLLAFDLGPAQAVRR